MLDFTLDQDQEMLEQAVKRFAAERLRKVYRDAEEDESVPLDVIRAGWELGLLQTGLPEAHGGFGEYSAVTNAIAAEMLGWGDLALSLYIMAPNLMAVPVLLGGTEVQKQRYLPQFSEAVFPNVTAAVIEPRIRFDPRCMETIALPKDGGYVLNGVKSMVPLAEDADLILVYANEMGRTQAYMVPVPAAGLRISDREEAMGIRALPKYRLELNEVVVPHDHKLGGDGGIDFDLVLNHSRIALGALAVGVANAGYEYALDYAKQREQFGEPIAHRQSIAFMLAEMAIDVETMRLLVWEAAWKLDQGDEVTREVTVMKHYVDDAIVSVADRAVQILGGYGYIREYPVELWLRNARGFAHFDGLAIF